MVSSIMNALEKSCIGIAVSCLLVMVAVNMVQILLRYVFNTAFVWVHPLTMLLFIWMTFTGAFVIYRQKKDIVVCFFVARLSKGSRQSIHWIANLLTIFLLVMILKQGAVLFKQQSSIMQVIPLPRYVQVLPLLAGLGGILLDTILDTVALVKEGVPFFGERRE